MRSMISYTKAAMERGMKVQEVILRALGKKITWWQAAEIIPRLRLNGGTWSNQPPQVPSAKSRNVGGIWFLSRKQHDVAEAVVAKLGHCPEPAWASPRSQKPHLLF